MPPNTKQNLSSLTKKPTTAISQKKPQKCWRITEMQKKKKPDLRTTTLNWTMKNNKNLNFVRFVFSLILLLQFHYNTRLFPFSPFFLSPFFLLFPFLRFCWLCAKKTYFSPLQFSHPHPLSITSFYKRSFN